MHVVELPDWARKRGEALNAFDSLRPAATALVNIDMQNVFLASDQVYGNPHALDIIPAVNALGAALRAAGGSVIWTRQTYCSQGPWRPAAWQYDLSIPSVKAGADALQRGAVGHALHPSMDVCTQDLVVDKYRYGALSCPAGGLGRALRSLDIETVIVTGTLTNCCCESTRARAQHGRLQSDFCVRRDRRGDRCGTQRRALEPARQFRRRATDERRPGLDRDRGAGRFD